jgi:HEPN domain-containing protein
VIDIEKQISYWKKGADSDIETAEVLIESNKTVEGLFFCHLAIEKILKAHFVKQNQALAPKSHKLQYLSEKAAIDLSEELKDFFGVLMQFQIEGRYPEFFPPVLSKQDALSLLSKTKTNLEWLTQKLRQ